VKPGVSGTEDAERPTKITPVIALPPTQPEGLGDTDLPPNVKIDAEFQIVCILWGKWYGAPKL